MCFRLSMRLSAFIDCFFRSLMILPSLFRHYFNVVLESGLVALAMELLNLIGIVTLTMEMPQLPDEIIFDILSRLPVKSLMRFKCVSKPWRSLISDPQFIRAHLLQQGKMKSKILLATQPPTLLMDYEDGDNPIVKLNYSVAYLDKNIVAFVGSCDGLACLLVDREMLVLWNPSTREVRRLPGPFKCNPNIYAHFFGFGYDSSIDDYKVVTGRCREVFGDNLDSVFDCMVEVFTLKSNKWKLIEFDDVGHYWYGLGVSLNGNLHWFSKFSEPKDVVLSFNIKEEKFMEVIPLPAECDIVTHQMCLDASENSLFISIEDCWDSFHLTMWKKSTDVVEDSWTKLCHCSLDFLPCIENLRYRLYITIYHKLLLRYNVNSVSTIDLEAMTRKEFPDTGGILEGIDYLESLVSPN